MSLSIGSIIRRSAALALTLALAACGGDLTGTHAPAGDVTETSLPLGRLQVTLLRCTAVGFAADSALIGPEGGTLTVGGHRLVIPAGAVAEPTVIGMRTISGPIDAVELSPHGLTFPANAAPTLSLSYDGCDLGIPLPKRVVYTDDQFLPLELPASHDAATAHRVDATLEHFSRYAVSY